MWASNYWADRYWNPRFWAKLGADQPPIPPVPPTPTTTTAGGFISGSSASNAGRGLFTGIYRPNQQRPSTPQPKLSRREKRLVKQSKSAITPPQKPFPSAPSIQNIATAENVAKEMQAMEEQRKAEKEKLLLLAQVDLITLEAKQKADAFMQARNLFLRQQDETAIILMLDDL